MSFDKMLTNYILVHFFHIILSVFQLQATQFSPEVRHFGPDNNGKGYKFGYMNVQLHVDFWLDVQPIKSFNVNKTEDCIIGCIREMGCCSMNIDIQVDSVGGTTTKNCSLLSTDKYRSFLKFVAKAQTSHFEIASTCLMKPCSETELCIPHYGNRTFECRCKPGHIRYVNQICTIVAKSCKEIKQKSPSAISGSYWIQLDKPTFVYCDMVTDGGGWMLIGNISSTVGKDIDLLDVAHAGSEDISILENLGSGDHLLRVSQFSKLHGYINITQFRIFCTKPYHGRVIHVMNKSNTSEGLLLRDFFLGVSNDWVVSSDTCMSGFDFLPDSTSLLQQGRCNKYHISVDSLYTPGVYESGQEHILLNRRRLECDDFNAVSGSINYGLWNYFVR